MLHCYALMLRCYLSTLVCDGVICITVLHYSLDIRVEIWTCMKTVYSARLDYLDNQRNRIKSETPTFVAPSSLRKIIMLTRQIAEQTVHIT